MKFLKHLFEEEHLRTIAASVLTFLLRVSKVFPSKKWKKKYFRDWNLSNTNFTLALPHHEIINRNYQILKILMVSILCSSKIQCHTSSFYKMFDIAWCNKYDLLYL